MARLGAWSTFLLIVLVGQLAGWQLKKLRNESLRHSHVFSFQADRSRARLLGQVFL